MSNPDGCPSGNAIGHLLAHYLAVRGRTVALVEPLQPEDAQVQSMPSASPAKWHLAHTTWFFEQFVLAPRDDWQPRHPEWRYLFNSYYQSVGPMHARPQRGLLTRPTLAEVLDFRARVDEAMGRLLQQDVDEATRALVVLGLNHEQQHQELLLTDIKHLFSMNPLEPACAELPTPAPAAATELQFIARDGGLVDIGHAGDGFAYDNELPRHQALLLPHAIANRLVTNAEYHQFVEDGGYTTPTLWLSAGWDTVQREGWHHPLYWDDELASEFTLGGRRELDPAAPVCHVSFFEADAFARWAGARLPSEAEWEHLAAAQPAVEGHFADGGDWHPRAVGPLATGQPGQLFGDVWEWTASPYVGYPGFTPLPGAVGEYNGKFMSGQWVLRGGSCVTPADHFRISYRNFFHPHERWQFMGVRLGRDA